MPGRVFISCGQASPEEAELAERVRNLFRDKFKLDPYLAIRVQGLNDIMRITEELRASDYYLFIDIVRDENPSISVFTHQELALAHHLKFRDIVILQHKDAPRAGILRYVQSNPEQYSDTDELLQKVEDLVRTRGWHAGFSRNLVVEHLGFCPLIQYADHTGTFIETTYQVRIKNHRPDVAAHRAVCILDCITYPDGTEHRSEDRSYLKWAGQSGYERTILPEDDGDIDLFSIHADKGGLFLHSMRDTSPRQPVVITNGVYRLMFKLFAEDFQLVSFQVEVDLNWSPPNQFNWQNSSSARLSA